MDLTTCLVQPSGIMLICSPGMTKPLLARLDKFILYGDKVPLRCLPPVAPTGGSTYQDMTT